MGPWVWWNINLIAVPSSAGHAKCAWSWSAKLSWAALSSPAKMPRVVSCECLEKSQDSKEQKNIPSPIADRRLHVILQVAVEPFWFSKGGQLAWSRRLLKTWDPVRLGCLAGSNCSNPFQAVAWRVWISKTKWNITKYHKNIQKHSAESTWCVDVSLSNCQTLSNNIIFTFQSRWVRPQALCAVAGSPTISKTLISWHGFTLGKVFLWISWRSHVSMLFLRINELPIFVPHECQSWQTAAFSRVCSALAMSTSFAALCSSQSWSLSDPETVKLDDSVARKRAGDQTGRKNYEGGRPMMNDDERSCWPRTTKECTMNTSQIVTVLSTCVSVYYIPPCCLIRRLRWPQGTALWDVWTQCQ